MSKPILDQRTFQTEDTSKTKCSICKKEGHNRRSCKNTTTPVSAPKIEAKTDVKVEMTSSGSTLTNVEFEVCESLYNKNNDLNTLYNNQDGIKYLMIRSFAKDDLIEISKEKDKKINIETLRINVFTTTDIEKIIQYTLSKKIPLSTDYANELSSELSKMCVESSSVHQDDFNSNMNKIIRSVDVSTYKKLQEEIEKKLVKQLKNYMTWQWYNQKCSDLIEDLILTQSNIIQTPRKIKNIDFFVKLDDTYIFPFDLKLTIFPAGFMKDNKIPNERNAIETYISNVSNQHKILKWLYAEQNPRLFSNNYRHFVILLNLDNTDNSYKLKCNIGLIKEGVNKFFTAIQKSDIIDIEYEYKKDKAKSGKYNTKCSYNLLITDE